MRSEIAKQLFGQYYQVMRYHTLIPLKMDAKQTEMEEEETLGIRILTPLCVVFSLTCLLFPIILRRYFYSINNDKSAKVRTIVFHGMEISLQRGIGIQLFSSKKPDGPVVTGFIGNSTSHSEDCNVKQNDDTLQITREAGVQLIITYYSIGNAEFYQVCWISRGDGISYFEDSFDFGGSHWYGLGHVFNQPWPMEKWDCQMSPVITGETHVLEWGEYYGGVQERFWLNSKGLGLFVDFDTPLFASINHNCDKKLVLRSTHSLPYLNDKEEDLSLKYTFCVASDVKAAYLASAGRLFPYPENIPDESMFRYPIWSTWAQYKKNINQTNVLEFARNIRKHGFKDAQLEIDDDWTPAYGDWIFDSEKFPDPSGLVRSLRDLGFRVTIWVHPFANEGSRAIEEGFSDGKQYWVGSKTSTSPCEVQWWNGKGSILDITNPEAATWLADKMENIRTTHGFDSFKIDAGEANRLSHLRKSFSNLDNPNKYTKMFVEWCYSLDTDLRAQEVRVGVGNQNIPMFFRLDDKDSNWSSLNGLKTLIPHVLTQGLLGYPFVLPDMIGGNAYSHIGSSETSNYPQRELFIRWMEANALMPAMQFSVVPWMYDEEVVKIANKMCALHEKYSHTIINLAREATKNGAPICRPLWWVDPHDETALTISTQFLLGDDILVAPVLNEGARSRDIYLPVGSWRCEQTEEVFQGGQWIQSHPAALDQLPRFTRAL